MSWVDAVSGANIAVLWCLLVFRAKAKYDSGPPDVARLTGTSRTVAAAAPMKNRRQA